jgi:hypothetical protein
LEFGSFYLSADALACPGDYYYLSFLRKCFGGGIYIGILVTIGCFGELGDSYEKIFWEGCKIHDYSVYDKVFLRRKSNLIWIEGRAGVLIQLQYCTNSPPASSDPTPPSL